MTIDGLSQSSGAERLLGVEPAGAGVRLTISDREGGVERERLVIPAGDLLSAVTAPAEGGRTIPGTSEGGPRLLDVEVRRNEVLLCARAGEEGGWDVAVGLDDLQDALELAMAGD
jgi:hypothetical protein